MDLTQIIEQRMNKVAEMEAIIQTSEAENRKLSAVEDREFGKLQNEVIQLDQEIKEKNNANKKYTKRKMENKFSLLKAIEARANGRSIEEYAEVIEAGRQEMRKAGLSFSGEIVLPMEYRGDILAGTQYSGQEIVTEEKFGLLAPLRDSLTLVAAGANYITGLVGDVSIPAYAGTTAAWKGEVTAADDGAGAFSEVTLAPKRLTCYIDISKQFLNQDSISAEQLLMTDIVNAVSDKLEATVLGSASGNTTQPAGIFYGASHVTGSTKYGTLVNMEAHLAAHKVNGQYGWIMAPTAKAVMKTTQMASGLPFILTSGNDVLGYPFWSTNAVATNHIVLADWRDLVIGQWGGFDLIVDPFTVAKEGKVRLVINAYFDAKFRRSESYVTGDLS